MLKYRPGDRVKVIESLLPQDDYLNLVERSVDVSWQVAD